MQIADCTDPAHVREDPRGLFVEIVNAGPWETVITGTMRAGAELGHHYHCRTRLFIYLVNGAADIDIVDVSTGLRRRLKLGAGAGAYLEPSQAHAIRFTHESSFILLKSRRYSDSDPDTVPFRVEVAS